MNRPLAVRLIAIAAMSLTVGAFLLATQTSANAGPAATSQAAVPSNLRWFVGRQVTIRLKDDLPPLDVPLSASSAVNGQNRTVLGTLVDTDDEWLYLRCAIRFGGENVTDIVAIRSERVTTIASRE